MREVLSGRKRFYFVSPPVFKKPVIASIETADLRRNRGGFQFAGENGWGPRI